jgi:hypothetical protein
MRSFLFFSLRVFLVALLTLGIFLLLLPTLMSSDWGRKQTLKIANHFIPGEIEVRSLKLQWGKEQTIEGFLLKDPEGQPVLEIKSLTMEAPLWKFLSAYPQVGMVQIRELSALLVLDDHGWVNLQQALGGFSGQKDLSVSRVELSHVYMNLNLFSEQKPFSASIKGITQQDNLLGSFDIDLVLHGLHIDEWNEGLKALQQYFIKNLNEESKIYLNLFNFPTDLLDHFSHFNNPRLKRLFHSFLGDRLDLKMDKEAHTKGVFNLIARSPLIEGTMKGKVDEGLIVLQEPATFYFKLTPEAVNSFTPSRTQLHHVTEVNIVLSDLSFPLEVLQGDSSSGDFHKCGFSIDTNLAKTDLNIHPLGLVNIHHFDTHLESAVGESTMRFKWIGYVEYYKKPLNINYETWLKKPINLLTFLQHPSIEYARG